MRVIWGGHALLAGTLAAASGASAQEPPHPHGAWRSGASETHTNPALTGASLYLEVVVASDGSFRGTWGRYHCTAYPGAYGIAVHSCSLHPGTRKPVSGRFGPGRRGLIDLRELGRSAFVWSTTADGELAIELPRNWQGEDAILYRARLTREGKPRPSSAPAASARRDDAPLPSAVALFREFSRDANAALARHRGKPLVLEGTRGNLIALSDGGAAIHVPDGFQPRALVLYFRDLREVSGIRDGARFRFRCTVKGFDYQYVELEGCSLIP